MSTETQALAREIQSLRDQIEGGRAEFTRAVERMREEVRLDRQAEASRRRAEAYSHELEAALAFITEGTQPPRFLAHSHLLSAIHALRTLVRNSFAAAEAYPAAPVRAPPTYHLFCRPDPAAVQAVSTEHLHRLVNADRRMFVHPLGEQDRKAAILFAGEILRLRCQGPLEGYQGSYEDLHSALRVRHQPTPPHEVWRYGETDVCPCLVARGKRVLPARWEIIDHIEAGARRSVHPAAQPTAGHLHQGGEQRGVASVGYPRHRDPHRHARRGAPDVPGRPVLRAG